jgi:hypothetical protein
MLLRTSLVRFHLRQLNIQRSTHRYRIRSSINTLPLTLPVIHKSPLRLRTDFCSIRLMQQMEIFGEPCNEKIIKTK